MTARKKKASKKKAGSALAKREAGMLPATLQEHFQKYIDKDSSSAKVEGGGFPFVSTRGGRFRFEDEALPNPMPVVILGAMRTNTYYGEEAYDPDNTSPPVCFAMNFEDDESLMAPPPDLDTRCADSCSVCPMNKFGSGQRGRGKACKNQMRLAMLPYGDHNFAKIGGARLAIPPTSLKTWGPFAKKVIEGLKRPLFSVVTLVSIEPDPKTQFTINFDLQDVIDDEDLLVTLMERVDGDGRQSLESVPSVGAEDATPERPARGGKQRRPVKKSVRKKGRAKK
jgi:hypothetical protein